MSDEMIEEFLIEDEDLFAESEEALLEIEKTDSFKSHYEVLFRCFHSLKGAAGMFRLDNLQQHMHKVENILVDVKDREQIETKIIDFFLDSINVAKRIINDEPFEIDYSFLAESTDENKLENIVNALEVKESEQKFKKKFLKLKKKIESKEAFDCLVYVVDDEEMILTLIESLLSSNNVRIKTFNDARKALESMQSDHPDAIITDIHMPEMTGLQLMKEVNEIYPLLPIIVVSGYITKEVCLQALSEELSGVLEKPFNVDVLKNQLDKALMRYKAIKIMNKSLDLVVYQFSNFEKFLIESGKEDQRNVLGSEL